MRFPDFFWIGPQKSASTWAYRCFAEHPEIYVHEVDDMTGLGGDALHYFDIHYNKGPDWYEQFFQSYKGEKVVGDTTPSYIRSPKAAERIASDVPGAKIIACLRNPIDRAFSHYWHEKKKQKINFEFAEILENYDLYQNWIEPGFYYHNLKRYYERFDEDQIKVKLLDDLIADDERFIADIFAFIGVDSDFKPTVLGEKVNTAGYIRNVKQSAYSRIVSLSDRLGIKDFLSRIKNSSMKEKVKESVLDKSEYQKGIDPELRRELEEVIAPEVKKLEELIDRDLGDWIGDRSS